MRVVLVLSAMILVGGASTGRDLKPPSVGARVADVPLIDTDGKHRTLGEFKDKKAVVVVFVGTECPIANLYFPTLAEMQRHYASKGVQVLAINSNDQDSFEAVVTHARERHLPFPVMKDDGQRAADAFGARRTPEAFLLDGNRKIRYRGRIDDQYGYLYRRAVPSRTELKDAIEELLAGKPITTPESECRGCLIGRVNK
jgi:peroxiredoxin